MDERPQNSQDTRNGSRDRREGDGDEVVRLEPFRVVETVAPPQKSGIVLPLKEEKQKHAAYEGKSIEKNIDELLQPDQTYDPNFFEKEWDKKKPIVRRGWQVVVTALLLVAGYQVYRTVEDNRRLETATQNLQKEELDREVDTAKDLVSSIEATIRRYYAAATIEEKLAVTRYAEQTRERMKRHYAQRPLRAETIDTITKIEPITLDHRTFWRVFVRKADQSLEMILLEQTGPSTVWVDWDSQVDYQAMPWEQYLAEKPNIAVSYRLELSESPRPIAEFSNEQVWACYCLTKAPSDKILFGYVRRGSDPHLAIETARSMGAKQMILRLQASSTLKAKNSVVIQEVISGILYRMDPPRSLYD